MKNLFKLFIAGILMFTFAEASAQISVGPGVVYGTDISSIGFSVNGKYDVNQKWAAAPSFTYFLKKNNLSWYALDLDANYQLTEIENFGGLYAIGGLNMTFYKFDLDIPGFGDASGSDFGVNLGLGLNIAASEKMTLAPEIRYSIGSGYLRAGVKVMFSL